MSYRDETCGCPFCEGCQEVAVYDHPRLPPPVQWWPTALAKMAWYDGAPSLDRARYSNAFHLKRLYAEHLEATIGKGASLQRVLYPEPGDPPMIFGMVVVYPEP